MKNFAKILPSRRFSAVLGSLVFVIALVWGAKALSMSKNPSASLADSPSLIASSEIERLSFEKANSLDADGDGLKDWEEVLWQTDAQNPDSDDDGTKDGEEINKNRNPKIKGPADTLRISTDSTSNTSVNNNEKLTTTDLVARDFFSKYLAAKQSGKEIDSTLEQQIASSVLLQTKTSPAFRIYGEGDLIIDKNDSTENLKIYGEQMGLVIKGATWKERELEIIKKALEEDNEKILEQLNPILSGYKIIIDKALIIKVPQKAVVEHLEIINSMNKILVSLEAAKNVFIDPINTMALFGKYPDYATSLYRAFSSAGNLFKRNNITYTDKENGFFYANLADSAEYLTRNTP